MKRSLSSIALRSMLLVISLSTLIGFAIATQEVKRAPAPKSAPTPQSAAQPETEKADRPTSDPYKGDLAIFENPQREQSLQIARVMDVLKIKEGSNVADIGAASGWFTVRAARRVGSNGTVYAVEINQDYLKHI